MKQCKRQPAFPFTQRGKIYYWDLTNTALKQLKTAPGLLADLNKVVEDLRERAEQAKGVCADCYKYISEHVNFYMQFQVKLARAINNNIGKQESICYPTVFCNAHDKNYQISDKKNNDNANDTRKF